VLLPIWVFDYFNALPEGKLREGKDPRSPDDDKVLQKIITTFIYTVL